MTTSTEVGKPSAAHREAAPFWQMVTALKGGTTTMRAAREDYLPKHEAEKPADYDVRLKRTFLFNAYARTIEMMVGKVFSKPVEPGSDVPDDVAEWLKDCDLMGADVHSFAAQLFETALDEGLAHVLVDLPNTAPAPTLADERAVGSRPYFALIRHSQVLGWRTKIVNGKPTLDQLRVIESSTEPDGEFGEKYVTRVRVYHGDGRWEIWVADKVATSGQVPSYTLAELGQLSIGKIPLVSFYAKREGFMCGKPRLIDLAWLNVEHWQKSSDQNHILHVARVPILFGRKLGSDIKIAPNSFVASDETDSTLEYVEHTGASIGAGREDLDKLVERMAALGVDMLIKKRAANQTADATATGKAITEGGENSILGNLARELRITLEAAIALMAEWTKRDPATLGGIDMDTQLGIPQAQADDVANLIKAHMTGVISAETLFAEMQRREVLDPSLDYEDEKTRIAEEGPPLGTGLGNDPANPNDPNPAKPPAPGDSGGAAVP